MTTKIENGSATIFKNDKVTVIVINDENSCMSRLEAIREAKKMLTEY